MMSRGKTFPQCGAVLWASCVSRQATYECWTARHKYFAGSPRAEADDSIALLPVQGCRQLDFIFRPLCLADSRYRFLDAVCLCPQTPCIA